MTDEPTQPTPAPKVTIRVGAVCPACRAVNTMRSWERTPWHAGNNWKSTCGACGAIERKQ